MGAVHGVYLKYVGISALSYGCYTLFAEDGMSSEDGGRILFTSTSTSGNKYVAWALFYSFLLNGAVALFFKLRWGMGMLGKSKKTGQIPTWSYLLFFPFHLPTILYTYVHHHMGLKQKVQVPPATEVQPGWWVGGIYSYELDKDWGGIIDLTVEFPERCIDRSKSYMLKATWDGVPADPEDLEEGAKFAVEARKNGDVLIHCAHGRGRSTTMMCAALVKAGLFPDWKEAFEKGIKPGRPVCKLNGMMRIALTEWQKIYVDVKKSK